MINKAFLFKGVMVGVMVFGAHAFGAENQQVAAPDAEPAVGRLPFSLSMDFRGGYGATDDVYYGENEIVLEKEFDVLNGMTVGVENLLVYEKQGYTDEITAGIGFGLLDFLSIGFAGKAFIADETAFGVDGILSFGHEFENIGLAVSDDNEFLYNFTDEAFEYVNTLCIEKSFDLTNQLGLTLALENELVVSDGSAESGLLAGPVLGYRMVNVFANYTLGIDSEMKTSHGAQAGVLVEI
ncbi:MAG: hypothetical protein ACLFSB_03175 [Chitinispirillaceae bacterium]